jgi:hypothetical protein
MLLNQEATALLDVRGGWGSPDGQEEIARASFGSIIRQQDCRGSSNVPLVAAVTGNEQQILESRPGVLPVQSDDQMGRN